MLYKPFTKHSALSFCSNTVSFCYASPVIFFALIGLKFSYGLPYLTELVPDLYLYLFLLLFAVFVRCTVAVCWLALSVTYSISLTALEACFIRD